MKTDELRAALAAIERVLASRTVVVYVVIDKQGNELRRITRPSFHRLHDPRDPAFQGEPK